MVHEATTGYLREGPVYFSDRVGPTGPVRSVKMAVYFTDQVHSSVRGHVLRETFVDAVKSLTAWIIEVALFLGLGTSRSTTV